MKVQYLGNKFLILIIYGNNLQIGEIVGYLDANWPCIIETIDTIITMYEIKKLKYKQMGFGYS